MRDRWRFGGGRAAGGDETEGGDQCGEQGGADQRRVPHVWSPAEKKHPTTAVVHGDFSS
jgi:hypothetical protein